MWVTDGWPRTGAMNSFLLESEHLYGPWRIITFLERLGPQAFFLTFPSRFLTGPSHAWLCYSANFSARSARRDGASVPRDLRHPNPPGSEYGLCLHEVELALASA